MSGEGLGDCEDAGARPQSDGVRTRGESIVELARRAIATALLPRAMALSGSSSSVLMFSR
jgi:hypothetical protein